MKSIDSPFGDLIRKNDDDLLLLVPPGVFAACPREPMLLLSFISEDMAHVFVRFGEENRREMYNW